MSKSIQLSIQKTNSFHFFKALFLVAFIFLSSNAKAQTLNNISITGTVFNNLDKTPLPGASIVLKNTLRGIETDFNGRFIFDNLNVGDQITVHFMGFTKKDITIKNNTQPLNIYLNENGEILSTVNLGAADTKVSYKTKRGLLKKIFN